MTTVNTEELAKKQQISRILDIDLSVQQQNESLTSVHVLNDMTVAIPKDMSKEQYYELTCRSRKRNLSVDSEPYTDVSSDRALFGSKDEIIYIDIGDSDTLQKLALKYNCTISELKLANKIYNDIELHALKTVKIPVIKGGQLYHDYCEAKMKDEAVTTKSIDTNLVELESKYKFRVQQDYEINKDLDYLSDEEEDIFDLNEIRTSETDSLLDDRTKYRTVRIGQPVDGCDEPFAQFIERMDKELEKNVAEVESKKESMEEVVSAMTAQVVFPAGLKTQPEKYGSFCSCTWVHLVFVLCLVAVVAPVFYFLYFYSKHKR